MSSASVSASTGSCVTTIAIPPKAASTFASRARTSVRARTSSDDNGSSSSRRAGSCAIARAIATRCASPPESSTGRAFARCSRSIERRRSRARSLASPARIPRARSPNATFSTADIVSKSTRSWKTTPADRSRGATCVVSSSSTVPSSATVPRSIGASPARTRTRVVLPAPFGPTSATGRPRSASIEASTTKSAATQRTSARKLIALGTFRGARLGQRAKGRRASATSRSPHRDRSASLRTPRAAGSACARGCSLRT